MTGFENPGDGEFLRQNDIAEFVDSGFLFVTFGILEFLNAVEDLAQIPGRINRQLVAVFVCNLRAMSMPSTTDSPSRSSLPCLTNLRSGTTFSSCFGSTPRISGASRRFWNSTMTGPCT